MLVLQVSELVRKIKIADSSVNLLAEYKCLDL